MAAKVTEFEVKFLFLFSAMILGMLSASVSGAASSSPRLPDTVTITWDGARAPVGRFQLVRKGNAMCAVRFTQAQRFNDENPSTIFNSGDESYSAEYDWWFQGDCSGDFTKEIRDSNGIDMTNIGNFGKCR